jgi:TPP-dependent 2-oxoacid decarboxylase
MFMEIGRYLNLRLIELGVHHVFGVPGDFNLSYLELLESEEQLTFIGNCNELNAAYAADGYARMNGFSALLTTYGVGDLSAINGIAGAYAENVAMIHISGIPPLHAVEQGALLHHTLVDGNYDNIMNCMREFTVAQTRLTPANAAAEIDRVLRQCILTKRPVHIQLPSDITHIQIEGPIKPLSLLMTPSDPILLKQSISDICAEIALAERPALLIDYEAETFKVTELLQQLAIQLNIPYASLSTAKNIMDESSSLFAGVYIGAPSAPVTRSLIEDSDCLIAIGPRFTDVGTAFFSHQLDAKNMIVIHQYGLSIRGKSHSGLEMSALLTGLIQQSQASKTSQALFGKVKKPIETYSGEKKLTQNALWQYIGGFLKPEDVIVAEVGTSNSALSGMLLPKMSKYIAQPIWGSIGYTLPALLGSMLATPQRRHILFIGDGSIQLTIQELSSIIRLDLKPIIFVLNNGGYTIERLIMGEHSSYNDIHNWKYSEFAHVFNAKADHQSYVVRTVGELEHTLELISETQQLCVVELQLPQMDAPQSLKNFAEVVARYDYGDYGYDKLMKSVEKTNYKNAI